MKLNFPAALALLLIYHTAVAQDTWTDKTDVGFLPGINNPGGRYDAIGFSIGSTGYIGLGKIASTTYSDDIWAFDPVANSWSQKASYTGGVRASAIAFTIGTKAYVGTGYNSSTLNGTADFYEYDGATNIWTAKAPFGGGIRKGAACFVIGSKGYVCSGGSSSSYTKDLWEYDPATDIWTQKTDLPAQTRSGATGFAINSLGYICGGSNGTSTNDLWEYSPASNAWTQRMSLGGTGFSGQVAGVINGKGYMSKGSEFWEYTPATNTWLQKTDISGPTSNLRSDPASFVINNKMYVGLGVGYDIPDLWEYDPTTNSWTQKANLGSIRREGAVAFSIDQTGYIGLGNAGSNFLGDLWAYDRATNTWTQKANFIGAERTASFSFVINGKGYVGGGYPYGAGFYQYDPVTNSWTAKANCAPLEGAVSFTINGKGYMGTGTTSSSGAVNSFYEYNPVTNTWATKASLGTLGRYSAAGFAIGNKGYIGTGKSPSDKKDFWEYDPTANTWTQKTDFGGVARAAAFGFSIGNKGYIGGGTGQTDFWEYDQVNNAWTKRADFTGTEKADQATFVIDNEAYVASKETKMYSPLRYIYTGSVLATGNVLCAGEASGATFNATGTINPGNVYTVQLSDANGYFGSPVAVGTLASTSASTNIPFTVPAGTGNGTAYRVRVVSSDPAIIGTPNNVALTIYANVTPSVTIAALPGTTICPGTNATFTATPVNGGAVPVYVWKKNGVIVSGTGNTYISNTLINGDQVTCEMTSNFRCLTSTTATSNTITMTVTPNVTPTISIGTTLQTSCENATVSFYSNVTNQGSNPAYQWKRNGVNVGSGSNTWSSSSLNDGDVITCVLTSNAACPLPASVTSNSVTVTVVPRLIPAVTISPNISITNICPNTPITFTATPVNGGSTPSFTWFVNGATVATNTPTYTTTGLNNNDNIDCAMTTSYQCPTTTVAWSNYLGATVAPLLITSVNITANSGSPLCAGSPASFTATPTNGGSSPIYQWKLNGTNVGTNSNSYSYTNTAGGDVVVCEMNSNALCASPSIITDAKTVNANPLPVITRVSTELTTKNYASYKWNLGGSPIPGATFSKYTMMKSGIYTVTVTDNNGCEGTSAPLTVTNYLNVSNVQGNSNIQVYPNPVNDVLHVTTDQKVNLVIKDITGRTVVIKNNAVEIDLKDIIPGTYLLQVLSIDGLLLKTEKIIKK